MSYPRLVLASMLRLKLPSIAFFLLTWVLTGSTFAGDYVIYVTWDGFRWQELFQGAEEGLISKDIGGVAEVPALREAFWRESPQARRELLLPFMWTVIAKQGQIFGDPDAKATGTITNGKKFSYPGYNEMMVGFADPRIKSNNKVPNPNVSVLEFLNQQPKFSGKVAAFATWDVFNWILNDKRSKLPVQTAWKLIDEPNLTSGQREINALINELPHQWRGNCLDIITLRSAREYLLKHEPSVLFIGLGETDEWAHAKRYDLYLEAAQRADQQMRELWDLIQSHPRYKNKTTLIISTDHGRGFNRQWTDHGEKVDGAEFIWAAAIGPEIAPLGVRENITFTQSQVAATLAKVVGEDFNKASPKSAPPIDFSK